MKNLDMSVIEQYIEEHIGEFHKSKIDLIETIKPPHIIRKINPYIFKAKGISSAHEIAEYIINIKIANSEEVLLNRWLAGLAQFINQQVYNGKKSEFRGIDMEFERDGVYYMIGIITNPKMDSGYIHSIFAAGELLLAKDTLRLNRHNLKIELVRGYLCGRSYITNSHYGYIICSGQRFWELISGEKNLYIEVADLIENKLIENREYKDMYSNAIDKFAEKVTNNLCYNDGTINWTKLIDDISNANCVVK